MENLVIKFTTRQKARTFKKSVRLLGLDVANGIAPVNDYYCWSITIPVTDDNRDQLSLIIRSFEDGQLEIISGIDIPESLKEHHLVLCVSSKTREDARLHARIIKHYLRNLAIVDSVKNIGKIHKFEGKWDFMIEIGYDVNPLAQLLTRFIFLDIEIKELDPNAHSAEEFRQMIRSLRPYIYDTEWKALYEMRKNKFQSCISVNGYYHIF